MKRGSPFLDLSSSVGGVRRVTAEIMEWGNINANKVTTCLFVFRKKAVRVSVPLGCRAQDEVREKRGGWHCSGTKV